MGEAVPGHGFAEKKCAKSAISAKRLLLMRWPARPSSVFPLGSPVTNGTIILPTRPGIDERPVCPPVVCPPVVRVIWPRMASGGYPVPRQAPRQAGTGGSGGVVFPKLSKLLIQEDALSAPFLATISALRRGALAGRRNAAERRNPLLSHYSLRSPSHRAGKRCSGGWRQMHGQSAPMQGQAGPSWQDGPEL